MKVDSIFTSMCAATQIIISYFSSVLTSLSDESARICFQTRIHKAWLTLIQIYTLRYNLNAFFGARDNLH